VNIPGEYFQRYQKQYTARYLAPGANLPPPDSAHARDTDVAATSVRDLVSTAARTQILGNRGRDYWGLGINDEVTKTTKIYFVTCVFFLPEKRVMHLQESQGGRGGSSAPRGVFLFYTSLGYPDGHDFELLRLSAGKVSAFVFTVIVLLVSFF